MYLTILRDEKNPPHFELSLVKNAGNRVKEFCSQYRSFVRNRGAFYSILCRSHLIKVKGPQSHAIYAIRRRKYRVYKRRTDCIVTEKVRLGGSKLRLLVEGNRRRIPKSDAHLSAILNTARAKLKTATPIFKGE